MIINSDTLLALRTNLKTSYQGAFKGTTTTWNLVAMKTTSTTASETYGWMGDLPQIREFVGERQIKNLKSYDFRIKNRKFELTIGVKRDDIADNNLSGYGVIASDIGSKTAKYPDRLVWQAVKTGNQNPCYDGQYFFDTDHPVGTGVVSNSLAGAGAPWFLLDLSGVVKPFVLQEREAFDFVAKDNPEDERVFMKEEFLYGTRGRMEASYGLWQLALRSQATLDETNFDLARQAMQAFKSENDELLGVRPTHIVVPPSLELAAKKLFEQGLIAGGNTNPLYKAVEIIVAPLLG